MRILLALSLFFSISAFAQEPKICAKGESETVSAEFSQFADNLLDKVNEPEDPYEFNLDSHTIRSTCYAATFGGKSSSYAQTKLFSWEESILTFSNKLPTDADAVPWLQEWMKRNYSKLNCPEYSFVKEGGIARSLLASADKVSFLSYLKRYQPDLVELKDYKGNTIIDYFKLYKDKGYLGEGLTEDQKKIFEAWEKSINFILENGYN